jgi:hypothetical protein
MRSAIMRWLLILGLALLAACQPAPDDTVLPTLAVLPSITPSDSPAGTQEAEATEAAVAAAATEEVPTATPFMSPTVPASATPTATPTLTRTLTPTPDLTLAARATETAAVLEAPTIVTFTPAPVTRVAQQNAPTPRRDAVATLSVTEAQFQEALDTVLAEYPTIQSAVVDFTPQAVRVQLTASGGDAMVTGLVTLSVQSQGNFATMQVTNIEMNAPEPPESFLEVVNGDFILAMIQTLDEVLAERLGAENDLETLLLTESSMELRLLVVQ